MALIYKDYLLDETNIDTISAEVQDYVNALKMERRNELRIRLMVEELLLNIMEAGGNLQISVGTGKQFGKHILCLRYKSDPIDPTKTDEDPVAGDMMRSLGLSPSWSYRGRVNTVSLVLSERTKHSTLFYVMMAVAAAIAAGIGGRYLPDNLRQGIIDGLLTPTADGFLGLLGAFSGLMILLTICNGILGMGDTATLERTGKSIIIRFIAISFGIGIASVLMVLPILNLNFSDGGQGQASQLGQLSCMFFDILPKNLIEPFQNGNTMQLIVIAMLVGVGLLVIGERGSHIRRSVGEATGLMQHIVSSICTLIPIFVFIMLVRQIWYGEIKGLLSALKPMGLIAAVIFVITVVLWLAAAVRLKCSPVLLLKKVMPPFLIALTTASSVSALPLGMETCEKKLGVTKSMDSFIYPLGSVIYKPTSVVYFAVIVCALADIYQIEVGMPWIVMAIVVSTLMTIAMPPIPGADIMCYSVLFSCLGIPPEAMVPATAISIVLDYYVTGFSVMLLIFQITSEADRLDSVDRRVLLDKRLEK